MFRLTAATGHPHLSPCHGGHHLAHSSCSNRSPTTILAVEARKQTPVEPIDLRLKTGRTHTRSKFGISIKLKIKNIVVVRHKSVAEQIIQTEEEIMQLSTRRKGFKRVDEDEDEDEFDIN